MAGFEPEARESYLYFLSLDREGDSRCTISSMNLGLPRPWLGQSGGVTVSVSYLGELRQVPRILAQPSTSAPSVWKRHQEMFCGAIRICHIAYDSFIPSMTITHTLIGAAHYGPAHEVHSLYPSTRLVFFSLSCIISSGVLPGVLATYARLGAKEFFLCAACHQ
jgi:hypothetical protein